MKVVTPLLANTILISRATIDSPLSLSKVLNIRGGSDISGSVDWRYFVAGSICAAASHGITTPIDVIKTKMQTNPEKYNKGMISATKDIVHNEGLGFLLTGLAPTVVGYGLEGALKFGFYETSKQFFATLTSNKFINFLLASIIAGTIAAAVLCPMEEARIKMVGDASWAKESLFSAMTRLIKENGILSTFVGLTAMLSKQIPYTMGKQVSFDVIAGVLYTITTKYMKQSKRDLRLLISVISAFFAAIVACFASQPGDMILTGLYQDHGIHHIPQNDDDNNVNTTTTNNNNNNSASLATTTTSNTHSTVINKPTSIKYAPMKSTSSPASLSTVIDTVAVPDSESSSSTFLSSVRRIYSTHGLGGFYIGFSARLAHVTSIITSQLVLYDILKAILGLPATGSH